MKNGIIVAINECDFGSTGTIAREVLSYSASKGYKTYIATYRQKNVSDNSYKISAGKLIDFCNRVLCRINGSDGFHNKLATKKLVKWMSSIKPTIIHLHNAHGRYLNLPLLFSYCKNNNVKIIWTLHDCWAFTGRCAHFEYCKCLGWKSGCGKCPSRKEYPASYLFDGSKKQLQLKKQLINDNKNLLTIVSPSFWLENYAKKSILKECDIKTIHNGIGALPEVDTKSIEEKRRSLNLIGKTVFFFASSGYSKRKGLEFFNQLAEDANNDFAFVAAGIENQNAKKCSSKVINLGPLNRTDMSLFFQLSDCFINPTLEDNFPSVDIESLSAGTPIITFPTGGTPEIVTDKTGIIVEEKGNYEKLKNAVFNYKKTMFNEKDCFERSKLFSREKMCSEYNSLIQGLLKE